MCEICNHTHRAAIETAVLNCSSDKSSMTLQMIADEYKISLNQLKVHMIMHATMGLDSIEAADSTNTDSEVAISQRPTLARACKIREADILSEVANEYLVTLKNLGRRINTSLQSDPDEVKAEKLITKPIADMYIGMGGEIRATVKTISELNQVLNGPQNGTQNGLTALATAIAQSAGVPQ